MPVSITVPQLGESVAEGTVSKWLKNVGDRVRKEEPIVEIQTDKINVEIPAPAEGTLQEIKVPEGTTVLVGTEIGVLAGTGEAAGAAAAPAAGAPAAGSPAPSAAKTPPDASLAAAAAAEAQPERPSGTPARAPQAAPPSQAPAPIHAGGYGGNGADLESNRSLSPAVRKLMRENQVAADELGRIQGSGVGGRVTRDDLLDYLQRRPAGGVTAAPVAAPGAPAAAPKPAAPLPSYLRAGTTGAGVAGPRTETVPFTKVRKLIAENMVRAKHVAAHTHCFDEVDMSAIVAVKEEWGPKLEAQGIKLTYMPFFIKASVIALREFPWMNAEVRDDTLIVKRYYNIGIAVGRGEKGLIVPNLKDCDRKNLVQIAQEVHDLASRARNDKLKPDEIQDGTFSISNAGVYGAINSAPVINVPDVAILGVHKIVERPVIRNGEIVARPMMNTVIGFDHRVVDGELAVKFLRRWCELVERPEMLWFYA